ncbi:hypothetical protein DVB69_00350 [Sporosarcina sp. BI001-red]|nr:hypothetical protein DVB69_00350 [Sporosarcina sp. BI001-red]
MGHHLNVMHLLYNKRKELITRFTDDELNIFQLEGFDCLMMNDEPPLIGAEGGDSGGISED